MEKCIGCELCAGVCPARCIYVRGRRQPRRRPGLARASATATSTRSTTCAASTATCAWRPAPPRPSPSRSCSSSPSPTAPTPSTPRPSWSSTTTAGPSSCPGRTGARARTSHTSAWMRATAPSGNAAYEGVVGWSGELGYGVRAPEAGQAHEDAPAEVSTHDHDVRRPRRRRRRRATTSPTTGTEVTDAWIEAAVFIVCAVVVLFGGLGVVALPQPGALRPQPGGHAVRHRRAVPQPGRPAAGRGAGDRLHRRHRGAHPLRDHAPRRRPATRTSSTEPLVGQRALRRHRRRGASSARSSPCSSSPGPRRSPAPARSPRPSPTGYEQHRPARPPAVHHLRLRAGDHRRPAHHRGGRRRRAVPPGDGRRADRRARVGHRAGRRAAHRAHVTRRARTDAPTSTWPTSPCRPSCSPSAASGCSCGATRW